MLCECNQLISGGFILCSADRTYYFIYLPSSLKKDELLGEREKGVGLVITDEHVFSCWRVGSVGAEVEPGRQQRRKDDEQSAKEAEQEKEE